MSIYHRTPLFRSNYHRHYSGLDIYYKLDCYQPTGSFKIRGMESLYRHHVDQGNKNFIIASGGNAGYSLAYAARELGARVKVIVPETTPASMAYRIRMLGADVEVNGKVWDESNGYATEIAAAWKYTLIHAFDHPLLWDGYSSMIDECAEEMDRPDKIVVAVGGGGLLCGIFEGMKRNGWMDTTVVTCETRGAASFFTSWKEKKVVPLNTINTIAGSLAAKRVTAGAIERAREFTIEPFIVSDAESVNGCTYFLDEYKVLVEPACGTALIYPYLKGNELNPAERILIIVCGGVGMDIALYNKYLKRFNA